MPLLPSTTIGTLEFRAICERVRSIPGLRYLQASALSVDAAQRRVSCSDVYNPDEVYDVPFDTLVIAVGARPSTSMHRFSNTSMMHEPFVKRSWNRLSMHRIQQWARRCSTL